MQASEPLSKQPTTRQPRWLMPLLLIAPIVAIFAPVIFADRSFAFRDGAHFYHPLFQWIAREWGAGRVPLWNPQENCGLPVLADATSSIFYPGKLVFALPLSFAWNYKLYIIGHVVLAALGMFALARRLKASEPAAVIAAIAYACGGNVAFQYCNVVFLVGAAWLPAALLAIEVIVASNCRRATIGLAVALAMMILGGDPQMAYHVLLAASIRLVCSWFNLSANKLDAPKLGVIKPVASKYNWLLPIPLLAASAIIAALLSAVQILPSSEATKSSERAAYNKPRNIYEATAVLMKARESASLLDETPSEAIAAGIFAKPEPTSHQERAYDFSIGPWRVIEFIWPNVTGRTIPADRRWTTMFPAEGKPWTPSLYLGLLPLLAGVMALRLWRTTPTVRWLTWLVVIFALASLGWYGVGWILREFYVGVLKGNANQFSLGPPVGGVYWLMVTFLPTYVYFRYPAKLMVVAVCALCALAAPSIDGLLARKSSRFANFLHWLAVGSGVLAFAAWVGLSIVKDSLFPKPTAIFGPFDVAGMRWDVIGGLLHTAVVAWLLRLTLQKHFEQANQAATNKQTVSWPWIVAGLTATEVAIANFGLIVSAPSSLWAHPAPVASALAEDSGKTAQGRYFRGSYRNWHPASFKQTSSPHRLEELERWQHDTLFPKYHLQNELALVESYGSLKSLDYESLLLMAREPSKLEIDGARVPIAAGLRLTACEYLVLPAKAQVTFADKLTPPAGIEWPEDVSLWRMKRTLPRAYLVPRVVQLPPVVNPLSFAEVDQRARDVLIGKDHGGQAAIRDFRKLAVVETAAALPAELTKQDVKFETQPECEMLIESSQHVRVRAKLEQAGLLVLADAFAPGWEASIRRVGPEVQPTSPTSGLRSGARREDVRQATIHRTNRCFRGVELAAGEWVVDFEYRPSSFYRGATVSALTWLLLMGGIGVTSVWRRWRS